jgi:hypothetical protein
MLATLQRYNLLTPDGRLMPQVRPERRICFVALARQPIERGRRLRDDQHVEHGPAPALALDHVPIRGPLDPVQQLPASRHRAPDVNRHAWPALLTHHPG